MQIAQISTGFKEIPDEISLNIYTQGCSLKCKGCQNPELQPFDGGVKMSPQEIYEHVKDKKLFSWICWLGGEPLQQLKDLTLTNELISPIYSNIAIYTGYTAKEIRNDKIFDQSLIKRLLSCIKLIKCGRWEDKPLTSEDCNQCFYSVNNNTLTPLEKYLC